MLCQRNPLKCDESGLTKAPPSALYQDLKTFKFIHDQMSASDNFDTKEAMEKHKKAIFFFYKPILDLQGCLKSAMMELKKARSDR